MQSLKPEKKEWIENMKLLFIGGAGNISAACVEEAILQGHKVTLLNRGSKAGHPEARQLSCDINNNTSIENLLKNEHFDVVLSFIVMKPEEIERDIRLFEKHCDQYIFISSASAYEKPPRHYRITESTPLKNPYWAYSRGKIACEDRLTEAYREAHFPMTIVRPSFTYSEQWIPTAMGAVDYSFIQRMREGKAIISHGDGQGLWQMTHAEDFARGLLGLCGLPQAIGQSFHITSDEVLSWDQIYQEMGRAIGIEPNIVHISSDFIAPYNEFIASNLLGDKACSMVLDNSKIKNFVPGFEAKIPFAKGIRRSIKWFEAKDERMKTGDFPGNVIDQILKDYLAQ